MSWVAVGVAAVGATASYLNNKEKKKNEQANMMANATAMEMSPWTHQDVKMMGKTSGSDIAAIMGGGLQGAQFGSQFHKPSAAPSETPGASGGNVGADGSGALGGDQMASSLGSQGSNFQKSMAPSQPAMAPEQQAQMPMPQLQAPQIMGSNGAQPGSPWGPLAQQKKPSYYGTY